MSRPALCMQTVAMDDSDREAAAQLGATLYDRLTRPLDDPLAHGAGIPVLSAVAAGSVDLGSAERVVLIPVLGATSFHTQREQILKQIAAWHAMLGKGQVLVLPTAPVWRNVEGQLPGTPLLTALDQPESRWQRTVDEIVLAVARLLEASGGEVQLFISHAKADLGPTGEAAKKIFEHAVTDAAGKAFFDAASLRPGEDLAEQLAVAGSRGVFVAVRGDAYGSRSWCQRELLAAKRCGLPTLTVEVLRRGERRVSAYAGNGPSMVWSGDAAAVVSRAMIEWLRAAHFRLEAARIARAAGLHAEPLVFCRPPELLDLAQGPLNGGRAQLVMHPDPELPVLEREILLAAAPRLRLATPTTAFRRLLGWAETQAADAPLQGLRVALGLSNDPDAGGPAGFTTEHVRDAAVYLARALISAGASIAYGGDLRPTGFTPLLAELVAAYNQTADRPSDFLHAYLSAPVALEAAPADLPLTMHHLRFSEDVRHEAIMPDPSPADPHPEALYHSDMRRVMALQTAARILLAGNTEPRLAAGTAGFGGRYPGVVEEAWRSLDLGRPVYVLGGFCGAAGLVADLLEGKPIPPQLQDAHWRNAGEFPARAAAIDADACRERLGLPQRLEDLAALVQETGLLLLADDQAAMAWNGLTVTENHELFRSRDPVRLVSLVLLGLTRVTRRRGEGKLSIELVHGSVTSARGLDALAVAAFDDVPLGGAGAAIDRAVGGRASIARAEQTQLISLDAAEIDADWLYVASLGRLGEVDQLDGLIERAARETAEVVQRHGIRRLGLVAFGGAVLSDAERVAQAMLTGLSELAGDATLVWFETSDERFDAFRQTLSRREGVHLTTRRITAAAPRPSAPPEPLILQVALEQRAELQVTALPPAGTGIASSRRVAVDAAWLARISAGGGLSGRDTPDPETLTVRGAELADLLLGEEAGELLARCRAAGARTVVVHDLPTSRLPFELLAAAPAGQSLVRPAVETGLSRRLAVAGAAASQLFGRPAKSDKLEILLVVNPTEDLAGTEAESASVRGILEQHGDRVRLQTLVGVAANRREVRKGLRRADVLHYSGHAYFDGPGSDQSGLILAGGERLTLKELKRLDAPPRLAFVNACESGRVRGAVVTEAAAFAELFLRSGVEAYLGTFWRVGDRAAAEFATSVYAALAEGRTLEAAVTRARAALFVGGDRDWANYILYGDGRFRLAAPP